MPATAMSEATISPGASFPEKETTMATAILSASKRAVLGVAHALGKAVKRLLVPARTVATATIGATDDMTKKRMDLIAENALLRQQLIVHS